MDKPIVNPEMTAAECAEMEKLVSHDLYHETFRAAYQMGFTAGKLSCLKDILNNSKLFNGQLPKDVGDKVRAAAVVSKRVAERGKKGGSRSSDRSGKDKAGQ